MLNGARPPSLKSALHESAFLGRWGRGGVAARKTMREGGRQVWQRRCSKREQASADDDMTRHIQDLQ